MFWSPRRRLSSLEARRPAFDERADSFLPIGGGDACPVRVKLNLESLGKQGANDLVDSGLAARGGA